MTTPSQKGVSRLAYQFKTSEKLIDFLEAFLSEFDELAVSAEDLLTLRYLDTAEGVQLDGIGEIVGIERPVGFTDEQYFYLLKVKILVNSTNQTNDDYMELVSFVFDGYDIQYILAENLSPTFVITGTLSPEAQFAATLLPNTLGIRVSFVSVPDPAETFSFSSDPTGKGWGTLTDPLLGGNYASILNWED